MATANERIGVIETRVDNLDVKLDDIKADVKEVHDCLHRTGEELKESGFRFTGVENYFPRLVKDYQGLRESLGKLYINLGS